MSDTDKIVKEVVMKAPRARVWRALTDIREFGAWFCLDVKEDFAVGKRQTCQLTVKGYEHIKIEMVVESIEPQTRFSYRWHPYAVDVAYDYSRDPMTLVSFELKDVPEGTHLTVTESGFDNIPLARRAEAFRMNTHGWIAQVGNIERYVADHP